MPANSVYLPHDYKGHVLGVGTVNEYRLRSVDVSKLMTRFGFSTEMGFTVQRPFQSLHFLCGSPGPYFFRPTLCNEFRGMSYLEI